MSTFDDFDLEIQNECDSTPEHINGTVTTAGSPNTLTPSSGKNIQLAYIKNPNKGTNANNTVDVLYITIDGTSLFTTLSRGEYIYMPGIFANLKIDTNNNGTKYEVIVWS